MPWLCATMVLVSQEGAVYGALRPCLPRRVRDARCSHLGLLFIRQSEKTLLGTLGRACLVACSLSGAVI